MLTKHTQELRDAFGYLSQLEVQLLQMYAEMLPKGAVCVNIGAGAGTSALAVLEKRPDLTKTFYTVDISGGGTPLGSLEGERNAFDKAKMPYPNQIHCDSKIVGKEWEREKIDFLIVDGDHSEEGIRGDIESWTPHLNSNAIIFFHDYGSENWKDVKDVVDELMLENKKYKLMDQADTYIVFKYIE